MEAERLTMREKKKISKKMAQRYQKASKKEKGERIKKIKSGREDSLLSASQTLRSILYWHSKSINCDRKASEIIWLIRLIANQSVLIHNL